MKRFPSRFGTPNRSRFKAFRAGLASAFALLPAACVIPDANQYLGKNPQLVFAPQFIVDQMTIPLVSGRPSVDWGMTLAWMGDHYILSVDENTLQNHDPQVWRIVAVQDIPLLKQGQMFAMGSCVDGQKPVPGVVAVVQYDPMRQWFTDIRGAWTYDFQKNAVVDYPTTKLECFNRRYGLALDALPPKGTLEMPHAVPREPPSPAMVAAPAAATRS